MSDFLKNTYKVRLWLHGVMAVCRFALVICFRNVKMHSTPNGSVSAAVHTTPDNLKNYKNPEVEPLLNAFNKGKINKFTR